MKKLKFFILGLFCGILFISIPVLAEDSLTNKLVGKILLAVEDKGKTYYVHSDGYRYRITKENIEEVFKELSLGINNENLEKIPEKEIFYDYNIKLDYEKMYNDKVIDCYKSINLWSLRYFELLDEVTYNK